MDSEDKQFFYSRAYIYFGMAFLVTIAGFWPSYFSRLGKTSVFHHFHGISATLWMLLLVVQPLLYRMDKIEWHRMSGKVSFLLVPALGRLFPNIGLVDNLVISLDVSYFVIEAVIILLILDDRRSGKIRLPYVLALGLMVTQHIIMHFIADWSWWQWLMDLYGSI
jgi:hypothetical protein